MATAASTVTVRCRLLIPALWLLAFPALACSLAANQIGAEGAQHLAEALKVNTSLKELKCAACCPRPSCQQPMTL